MDQYRKDIAEALSTSRILAVVGREDAMGPLVDVASSAGMRIGRIDAATIAAGAPTGDWPRSASGSWLILVCGCGSVGSDDEDAILDFAFDGDPCLPQDALVALCFDEPCELSEALADDAIPCTFLAPQEESVKDSVPLPLAA